MTYRAPNMIRPILWWLVAIALFWVLFFTGCAARPCLKPDESGYMVGCHELEGAP